MTRRVYVVLLIFVLSTLVLLQGCATGTPLIASDCEIEPWKQMWEGDVDACKVATQKKEDHKFKRKAEKDAYNAAVAYCTNRGMMAITINRTATSRRSARDVVCMSRENPYGF
jgi:hypothetical protein